MSQSMVLTTPEPADGAVRAPIPALEISGLSIALRTGPAEKPLVTDVSLAVDPGEIVGLVGESGSGKSLTALATIGLLPHGVEVSSGEVRLAGESLLQMDRKRLRSLRGSSISMIFQDPLSSLDPCARIGNQIVETIRAHKRVSVSEAKRDAVELLDRVGIPRAKDRMRSYPYEFSGGMRQRVMIAAALVLRPRVLLADEPTTALDVTTQAGIVELVRELRSEMQMSVIWISHDLALVGRLADRVAVMYAGEIVELAAAEDVFRSPRHPYTEGLIRSGTRLAYGERFGFVPGTVTEPGHWPEGCRFSPRCERATEECISADPVLEPLEATTVRCVHPLSLRPRP
jgi:oligopeptide/dipeptide ABC transporter ATP-binding protein